MTQFAEVAFRLADPTVGGVVLPHILEREAANESPQWARGEAFCLSCNHHWQAMRPTGDTSPFECPGCRRETGHWKFEFYPPPDTDVRQCNCGNQLFYLTREGHMCANCGTYQRY